MTGQKIKKRFKTEKSFKICTAISVVDPDPNTDPYSREKGLYLSQIFILVEIICANQSEAKFLCLSLESCQDISPKINQFTKTRENMTFLS